MMKKSIFENRGLLTLKRRYMLNKYSDDDILKNELISRLLTATETINRHATYKKVHFTIQ